MLKIKDGFVMRNICDEWIIVPVGQQDGGNSYIMTVNDTGHFFWQMLEKGTSREEMLNKLLEEYEVDEESAIADIDGFIRELHKMSLLL